jgi:signal transduction histidine kinase
MIDSFSREAETKGVSVKMDLERSLVVEADALRLRQIVSNLVSNALKFTPAGGDVFVTLRRERTRAVVTVADSGAGIPADVLPHIFERFRQADSSTTRQHGGLGLGLAIVKSLVELHGGNVRAENRTDVSGAVLTVELPLAE